MPGRGARLDFKTCQHHTCSKYFVPKSDLVYGYNERFGDEGELRGLWIDVGRMSHGSNVCHNCKEYNASTCSGVDQMFMWSGIG